LMIFIVFFGVGPSFLTIPIAVGSVLTFLWCVKCAYQSERFSDFVAFRLFFSLAVGPILAFVFSHMLMYGLRGVHWAQSLFISALPIVLVALMYVLFYSSKGRRDVFIIQGGSVDIQGPKPNNPWLLAGVSAGGGGMVYSAMQEHGIPMESLVFLIVAASLYNVFYFRNHIFSLKSLKQRERRENCHYTFKDIEHIRELRQASFLGRLFAVRNKH